MQLSLKADEQENEMDRSEISEEENSECNDIGRGGITKEAKIEYIWRNRKERFSACEIK